MGEETTKRIIEVEVDQTKAISHLVEYQNKLKEITEQEKLWKKQLEEGILTQEDYDKKMAAANEVKKEYRRIISETSKEIQNSLKQDKQKADSLKSLRAELSNATKHFDEMSKAERESAQGQELLQHIKEITDEIKSAEEDTERYFRNVGNYPNAVKPVTQAIKEMTQELIQMKLRGEENTEEYQQMLQKVGEMKDAIGDTQQAIKGMASDTAALDSVLGAAQLTAGAFSTVMGVLNLVGDKDSETMKEVAEAQRKLQAAIAITTGLQSVQNALQKQSNVMLGIAKVKAWAAAKATDAQAAATGRATIAQKLFNVVANANPYVLLATAILTVVGALAAFTIGSKENKDQQEEVTKEYESQVDVLKRLQSSYDTLWQMQKKSVQNALDLLKAQGASLDEIRAKEDEMTEIERQRIEANEERYAEQMQYFDEYKRQLALNEAEYKKYNDTIIDLENRETGTLTANEEAQLASAYVMREACAKKIDFFKEYVDTLGKIVMEREEFDNKVQIRDAQRAKEDQERRQKEAETRQKKEEERRRKEEEERKKYEQLTLTEMQKAEDALNALIADEYEQRRAIEETAYRRKTEALQKSMKEEEDAHGKDTDLYRSYLQQLEALRRQHEQTMSDIAQDQFQNEQAVRDSAIRQLESDRELYWQNRINELIAQGQETGQVELQMLKDQLDNMTQYVDESDAEFYARRLEAQIAYNQKKEALNKAEMAMEKAKADYMSSIAGSISSLLESVADDNKAMVKASKIVALAEVAIKQGVAIAEAVASSAAGDPYTYALRVAAAIASTVAAMATAIQSINSVKLARGGKVKGPGSRTSDSVPAMLSKDEFVVNAESAEKYAPLLEAINNDGKGGLFPGVGQGGIYNPVLSMLRNSGGAPIQVTGQQEAISRMTMASAMREAMEDLDLYVSVEEINRTENRVKAMEQLSTV